MISAFLHWITHGIQILYSFVGVNDTVPFCPSPTSVKVTKVMQYTPPFSLALRLKADFDADGSLLRGSWDSTDTCLSW